MIFRPRFLVLTVASLALFAAFWTSSASQSFPELSIPPNVPADAGQPVVLPLTFAGNGAGCSALVFSIDYDETRLSFDPADADGDGVPDSLAFSVPSAFGYSATFDAADTDGEIDIFIADTFPPLVTLPDGPPVQVTFGVLSGVSGLASVDISSQPAPSCGTPNGTSVPVTTQGGSVFIVVPTAVTLSRFAVGPSVAPLGESSHIVHPVDLSSWLSRSLIPVASLFAHLLGH